jgi:hypothetical protein
MLTAVMGGILGWYGPRQFGADAKPVKPKKTLKRFDCRNMTSFAYDDTATFSYDGCAGTLGSATFVYDADSRPVTVVDRGNAKGTFPISLAVD